MPLSPITIACLIIGAFTLIGVSVTIYKAMGWQFELECDQWRKQDGAAEKK